MSRAQTRAVALCLVMNLVDGFDLLVTSFVGPTVTKEWGLQASLVGVLLSSGLAGMAFGALFLAPLADRVGRRKLVLGGLVLASLGMLAAAFAQNFGQLVATRVVTGIAVGLMAACLPVLASEYSSHKRRGLSVALITCGYGLGAIIAGIAASLLIGPFGWRSVFVLGAVATAILFLVGLRALPESMDYLVAARPRDALARLNRILVQIGHAPVEELPAASVAPRKVALESLFQGRNAVRTVLVWIAFIAAQTVYYFASSWTPTLLLQAGLSAQQGISGGVLFSIGGVCGAALLGVLATRVEPRMLTAAYFALGALALVLYSFSLGALATALIVGVLVGLLLNGTVSGVNVIVPIIYPAESRATALGIAVAVSRLGAVFSPLLAGFLLQAGWAPESMFRFFAIPAVVGAVATIALLRVARSSSSAPTTPAAPSSAPTTPAAPAVEGTPSQA
ncbi:MFS transporter [Pseudonocardia kujensis]|uniref:MFS transporter n=1 Tax=Pseudonocardia kujensis TaxID=1128675 RepID=UPI001E50BFA7|nr:MFS transporter [Pseudonocardia kujensis]MCE0764216.1 MFS transporter [Pseudonocardia kujensis]